jgi:hypothetical protein
MEVFWLKLLLLWHNENGKDKIEEMASHCENLVRFRIVIPLIYLSVARFDGLLQLMSQAGVNFANIFCTTFLPIFWHQKISKPNVIKEKLLNLLSFEKCISPAFCEQIFFCSFSLLTF